MHPGPCWAKILNTDSKSESAAPAVAASFQCQWQGVLASATSRYRVPPMLTLNENLVQVFPTSNSVHLRKIVAHAIMKSPVV